jgi:hypothetical protein
MAHTAEEIGLYNDLPPDATVDGWTEDAANPGWAEVSFSDGRKATLPTESAASLPQTPPDPAYAGLAPGVAGPPAPVVPPQEPMLPEELAATGTVAPSAPAVGFAGMGALGASPLGAMVGAASAPADVQTASPTATVSGESQVTGYGNPYAEVIDPGSPGGGLAPDGRSDTQSVTTSSTVDSPEEMQGRLSQAAEQQAQAARMLDQTKFNSQRASIFAEQDGRDQQAEALEAAQLKHDLEAKEHAKFIAAVEANPIDEDGFWNESPGRTAGAWIALGLSGFLQGATKGQNSALSQMVAALDGAQSRWLANQQKNRDGVLARRERAMGNAENARDSVKMQLAGIMNKRIELDAQLAGLAVPPGIETYRARLSYDAAKDQNAVGSRIDQQSTLTVQEMQKARAATGPVRAGDVVRQRLGVDDKKWDVAMDPKGADLGGTVKGAERLQAINARLQEIKAKFGDLPQQNFWSASTFGAAKAAGRLGDDAAKVQLEATALLKEAALMLKQSAGTTKYFDSDTERLDLEKQIDTGEAETTLAAIQRMADRANTSAVNTAARFSQDPQGLIDYVREVQKSTRGVGPTPEQQRGAAGAKVSFKPLTPGAPKRDGEAAAAEATTGGGPAPSAPLAPTGSTPQTPPPSATALSQGGTYLRGRFRKPL